MPPRSLLARRAALRLEAAALIETHGTGAWEMARVRARRAMRGTQGLGGVGTDGPGDRTQIEDAWRVVHLVEKRLGIRHQPDTATRWLESPVRLVRPRPWAETPAGRAVLDRLPRGRDG